MNITGHSHYTAYIGGLSRGGIDGSHSFINCSNYGDINVSGQIGDNVFASNKGADCFIGGLAYACAGTTDPKTYVNCHNYGNITLTESCTVGGATRIGGIFANVDEDATKLVLDGCTNNGDITLNHISSNYESSNYIIGGCISHLGGKATLTIKNGMRNNGNVTVNGENKTAAVLLGGIFGNVNATTTTTVESGYLVNTGNILFSGKAKTSLRIGGVVGTHSAASFTAPMISTGNITVTGTYELTNASNAIGGVVAANASPIKNAQYYGFINAVGSSNVGLITGTAYSSTIVVSDSAAGGKMITWAGDVADEETGQNVYTELPGDITAENYFNHIYGSATPRILQQLTM
jgi:hypothetical protein